MRKLAIRTPEGTRDRLFSECAATRRIEAQLTDLFRRRGYSEAVPPTLEYYDTFQQADTSIGQESMYKLVDRDGMLLVLRPDMTTPIARMVATKLGGSPPPYRLCYVQPVFRAGAFHSGRSTELRQAGVELIGAGGLAADVEVLSMAVEAFQVCGVEDFRLEIGHAGFFRALAASLGCPAQEQEQMRVLVENKNFAALSDMLGAFGGSPAAAALRKLPQLFGGQEVLDEALSLMGEREAGPAIGYLRKVYRELDQAGLGDRVMIDLGLVHQIDYYTGLVFRGYGAGSGGTVITGGRYDQLTAAFGRELPATGFAVDVDLLAECRPVPASVAIESLVWFATGCLRQALAQLDSRPAGTCELAGTDTLEEALRQAESRGIGQVLVVTPDGVEARKGAVQ